MDKKKSILNVSVSIIFKVVILILSLYVRRLLINYIGNEVNGLNSLYTSIIGFLSVAELGVGSAIVFSMYKPIVEHDTKKVAALYCLYKKLYLIIGGIIFFAGLALIPFLPKFVGDYQDIEVNVYLTFFLMLLSVVLSYMYSAKTSLIEAYKDNYVTTAIVSISELLMYGLQILVIITTGSYTLYLGCRLIEAVVVWILTDIFVRKKHSDILGLKEHIDTSTQKEISKNVKAMFMHKIGGVLVSTIDSMIISAFIGVVILGKYTNYTTIMTAMVGIISLFFSPLTSVVGHLCAAGNINNTRKYFNFFYGMNYVLGVVFFLGYYAVIDNIVGICFGPNLEMGKSISFIITLNQFIQFMRKAALLFRDASGTFYNDRWKPIAEGLSNLVLSIWFVKIFPEAYNIVGVIVATIITTLLICDIVEPFILFKHVFKESVKKFYLKNYIYIGLFTACMFIMTGMLKSFDSNIVELIVNGLISVGISFILFIFIYFVDKEFRDGFIENIKLFFDAVLTKIHGRS